ncbi:MAG: hypothetical protein OHM77_11855 [Candidatus Nitricoxidivorans perseverans]|uniref:Uncharacterized protein n=1 Tax=Candidatus Nitricoxidivorans perseverans TaxID=2975601 RepID=A0AA49FJP4_9PROT|nr:MAG: hypothetical protein OHM77_11855 [Candidatus Nitricoxidivorans perseverans]
MKTMLALTASFALFAVTPAFAQPAPVNLGADPAIAIAGRDLQPSDSRVAQAREWLKKVAAATGETEEQVAASCMKLVKFMLDSVRVRALPAEVLDGLALQAAPGKPLSELTSGYYAARRAAPGKTHAEAMAVLAAKK